MFNDIYDHFKLLNELYYSDNCLLLENDLTYYELRKFVTSLFRNVKEIETKKVLADILKALAVLEIKNKPVPTIKKLKATSPKIFK